MAEPATITCLPNRKRRPAPPALAQKEYLAFRLADTLYASDIARIGEVLRIPPITPVPRAPQYVMGIGSVRGRVVTVLDLRQRLLLPAPAPSRHARLLMLPMQQDEYLAVYVDEVLQVYRFADTELEPSAQAFGTEVGEHLLGLGRQGSALLVLLDLDLLLKQL